jgi:MoaA/NifB/PqqE/SkfB family radical SAM enzyme
MSKTFCPIPWIFQAARPNGDIRVCCQANVTKNKGVVRKTDGTAYNSGRDNINESRNATMLRHMRLNMINGLWNDECGRCRQEEQSGLVSRRSYELLQWNYTVEQAMKETAKDGSIDVDQTPVRYYDFRFGNFCNLKCRMCGPTDSSAWYDDWIELTGKNTFNDTSGEVTIEQVNNKLQTSEYDWPSYEPFWQALEKNAKNIEHVYFAGGEPMLIERHYDFLERCVEQDVAKNIVLEYNTNCSTLPNRVLTLWKHFKQVRVGASIDGMNKVFEYQRYPAKWEKTLKNLRTLDMLPENVMSWLAFTVTAYNVNHMIDFMKWKLTDSKFKKINSTKRRPIITYHVAHHPKHLNIRVLPDHYKQSLTVRFKDFIVWLEENNFDSDVLKHANDIVNGITTYMNSESYYNEHWNEFVDYTKKLDKIRGERIFDIEPKFGEYIHEL